MPKDGGRRRGRRSGPEGPWDHSEEEHRPAPRWEQGVVKFVEKEKGFGFIRCQEPVDDKGSRDVFVPEKIMNGFGEGDYVVFQKIVREKGPQAISLEHDYEAHLAQPAHGPPDDDEDADYPVHEGTIVKFDESRGFGFIHSEELNEKMGKDVFVHGKQLNGFWTGDRVRFQLRINSRGQPQAGSLEAAPEEWQRAADSRDSAVDLESSYVYRGTIRAKVKGHAYIHCTEATRRYGQDVFVHHTKVGDFDVGDPVNFTVVVSHRGQPQAQKLTSVLPPELTLPPAALAAIGACVDAVEPGGTHLNTCMHAGVIKSIDSEKGFAFIECEELHIMYGCDTFVEKKQLTGFHAGDYVRFAIKVNARDQPQAVGLVRARPPEAATAWPDRSTPSASSGGATAVSKGKGVANDGLMWCEGVVKKLDTEKGFGFIFCQEIHDRRGSDVYIDKKDIGGLSLGDRVSFSVKTNARGKLQAVGVVASTTTAEPGGEVPGVEVQEEVACSGTIKSFDEANGYGFISSAEVQAKYGRDVFLHHAQIKNFKVGDLVIFHVRINQKGAPQAHDLREAPLTVAWLAAEPKGCVKEEAPAPPEPIEEEEHSGVIKSFNNSKGYGFIDCKPLFDRYGRDVFIHQSQFEGRKVGESVVFKVQVVKGQPQARDVAKAGAAGGPAEDATSWPAASGASAPAGAPVVPAALRGLEADVLDRRLLRACASTRVESVEAIQDLLAARADPNVVDEATGQSPLMVSALNARHSERKCRLLVDRGADVQAKCSDTHNVLQWARERINARFAAYLEALHRGEDPSVYTTHLNDNPPEEF